MSNDTLLQKVDGQPCVRQESELLVRFVPFAVKETANTEYQGFKDPARRIPFKVMREVLAFMEWGFDTHQGEVLAILMYHEGNNEWQAWAPPQRLLGLSVERDLPEADDKFRIQRKQFKGFYEFGSVHHHCGLPPGPSEQDKKDEAQRDGYHLTFGNMNLQTKSVHCRSWVKGFCQQTPVSHMVAPHPDFTDEDTERLLLTCSLENVEFPEYWKRNVRVVRNTFPSNIAVPRLNGFPGFTPVGSIAQDDFFAPAAASPTASTAVATKSTGEFIAAQAIHDYFVQQVLKFFGASQPPKKIQKEMFEWVEDYLTHAEDFDATGEIPEQYVDDYVDEWFLQYFPDGEPWNTAIESTRQWIWSKISPCG